jgi:hypothetical protein
MYWATGSARVLAVEPSLLKPSNDGEDEELELVLPVITSGQDRGTDIEANSQKGIMSRVVKGAGSGIVDMARNEQGSLWATITRESIQLWVHRVKEWLHIERDCRLNLTWQYILTNADAMLCGHSSIACGCNCQDCQDAKVASGSWCQLEGHVEARLNYAGCRCKWQTSTLYAAQLAIYY